MENCNTVGKGAASNRISDVTPVMLEVILHYHYSTESYCERASAAVEEAIRFWLTHQMLELSPDEDDEDTDDLFENRYITTDKGKAYIEGLCKMPFPVPSWSIPRSND